MRNHSMKEAANLSTGCVFLRYGIFFINTAFKYLCRDIQPHAQQLLSPWDLHIINLSELGTVCSQRNSMARGIAFFSA